MNPYLISLRSTTTSPSLSILYSRTPCGSSSSTVTNFFPTVLSCIYSKSRFSLIIYQNSSCQDHQRYSYCYYQLPILLLIALSVAPNIIDTLLPESFFSFDVHHIFDISGNFISVTFPTPLYFHKL